MGNKNLPALFIGRFQPFHLGHMDALSQCLRREQKIIIAIGSAQYGGDGGQGIEHGGQNPFNAKLRRKMIIGALREAQIPRRRWSIFEVTDIHDDSRWVAHVEKLLPKFGTIYSGSKKVQKLFKKNGKHPVAKLIFNLPVSGTEIRRRMEAGENWEEFVPKAVARVIHTL